MNSAVRKEINEVLEGFGLHPKDRDVYLAMLPLGPTTLTPLARASQLPLTTVQSIVERLVKHGLIGISQRRSRHVYEAHDPSVLRTMLVQRAEEVASIIPDLRKLMREDTVSSRVKIFTRERVTDIFNEALRSNSKLVYEIVAAKELQDVLGEKYHFSRRRIRANVRLRSLRVANREIKKYTADLNRRELREARILPREMSFRANMMWWDETVVFFSIRDEGVAAVITSPSLRETLQQIFDVLWSVSRQYV